MANIVVRIQSLEDRKKVPKLFPEVTGRVVEGDIAFFGILEGGMQSGSTSCGFIIKMPDGLGWTIAQVSLGMLENLYAAAKGADERFKDAKAKN